VEPPEKVDIIVSEWMGYFLLFEEVINTIIAARNVWLKPDGLMFPDKATIYLALSDCQEFHDSKLVLCL
jgi:protein arginine N-methyltransferase 1